MPILKSAKKRMKQNLKRRARNYPVRSELKTIVKKVLTYIKDGNAAEAIKLVPKAYSIIDMSVKKNILHANTAARKKSRIAKGLNDLQQNDSKEVKPEKKEEKK